MCKVVLDVIGLQAVQVGALVRGAEVQVVVDHVVDDVAQQAPRKHGAPHRLGQDEPEEGVEEADHQRGRHRGEDQAGLVEGGLVVLAVQDEVQHDEVIAVAGGLHVEEEAVDEVLDEAPEEHPQHEEAREHGLGHGYRVLCGEGCEESDIALGEGLVVGPTEVQHQGNPDDGHAVPDSLAEGLDEVRLEEADGPGHRLVDPFIILLSQVANLPQEGLPPVYQVLVPVHRFELWLHRRVCLLSAHR